MLARMPIQALNPNIITVSDLCTKCNRFSIFVVRRIDLKIKISVFYIVILFSEFYFIFLVSTMTLDDLNPITKVDPITKTVEISNISPTNLSLNDTTSINDDTYMDSPDIEYSHERNDEINVLTNDRNTNLIKQLEERLRKSEKARLVMKRRHKYLQRKYCNTIKQLKQQVRDSKISNNKLNRLLNVDFCFFFIDLLRFLRCRAPILK